MAEIDVTIQRFFMDYVLSLVYVALFLYVVTSLYPRIKAWIVWQQLHESERCYANLTRFQRQELLAPLHGLISADWSLRNEGVIRVVDVGVMTGLNLRYFPNSTHVVAVDTEYNLEFFFKPLVTTFDHLRIKKCIEFDGDTLEQIPDNYADAVVGSFLLCKTNNSTLLLNEIHRILAPGGRYYFIEHTHDKEDHKLARQQTLLSVLGIWPHLFNGCHLNRDSNIMIHRSPFAYVHCKQRKYNFVHPFALRYVRSHIMGYALK